MPSSAEICCEILLTILPPSLGVGFIHGCCSVELLIRLSLTFLGYALGIIYVILS
ncbi:hypothetical protein MKW98_000816 [Papaver atlanticum]|uniref:Uncharacterized protein n=1 Tax=Papaver atlanticum TaxID=357466 RepID=A0AAD4XDB1_9MAGN|nr:hypothetical protein MKW98_000816 [Papaver atlanticum]